MPRHKRSGSGNGCLEFDDGDEDCGKSGDKPGQRNAANARERARMRILSKAFSRLKTTLPWVPPDTKLSKLDTLRLATSYIAHLRTILTDDGGNPPPIVHPLNLTWPFTIQQQTGDRPLRSPDSWSTEERQASDGMPGNLEIMSGFGERPTCSLGSGSEDRTRLFYSRSNHFISDIRHRDSDSLLNIG